MRRGISEESVLVLNPLPAVDDAEVLERAGLLETAEAVDLKPLYIDWQYSAGAEREFIRLLPGESKVLRQSDASAMMHEVAEKGLCLVSLKATDEELKNARAGGIKRAITFYTERGNKRLQNIRKRFGLTAEEMKENRHEHWSFYFNQALADILREELNKLVPNVGLQKKRAKEAAALEK
jgi:hypothetical protein